MNLSETAFLRKLGEDLFSIRWFTPACEVDLCGHATLASAHVLFTGGHGAFVMLAVSQPIKKKGGSKKQVAAFRVFWNQHCACYLLVSLHVLSPFLLNSVTVGSLDMCFGCCTFVFVVPSEWQCGAFRQQEWPFVGTAPRKVRGSPLEYLCSCFPLLS